MSRSTLRLDSDGQLALLERSVERSVREHLELYGWAYIETKAENRKRSGAAAHARYTLDAVATRPIRGVAKGLRGASQTLYLELKKRKSRTDGARLKGQTETAEALRRKGFVVYQAAEKSADPVGDFLRFYEEVFG